MKRGKILYLVPAGIMAGAGAAVAQTVTTNMAMFDTIGSAANSGIEKGGGIAVGVFSVLFIIGLVFALVKRGKSGR